VISDSASPAQVETEKPPLTEGDLDFETTEGAKPDGEKPTTEGWTPSGIEEGKEEDISLDDDKFYDNKITGMLSRFRGMKTCFMTAGGKGSDWGIIYIAWSKDPKESVSHMKKQL